MDESNLPAEITVRDLATQTDTTFKLMVETGPATFEHENVGAPNERATVVFEVSMACPDGVRFGAAYAIADGDDWRTVEIKRACAVRAVTLSVIKRTAEAAAS